MIWPVLRLVWESKGDKLETVAEELTQAFGSGYSAATLTRLTKKTKDEVPEKVAAFVLSRPIQPNHEESAEIVRRGLESLAGGPPVDAAALAAELATRLPKVDAETLANVLAAKLPQVDPKELAQAVLAKLPADELASKLAESLIAQAGLSSGTGSLFDVFARAVADRLPRMPKSPRLARALVAHLAPLLDQLSARRLAVAGVAGGIAACAVLGLGLVGLAFLVLSGRLHVAAPVAEAPRLGKVARAPESALSPEVPANIARPPLLIVNMAQGGTPILFDLDALLGAVAAQMGSKKVVDYAMPSTALPGQKTGSCIAEAGETLINGACWVWIADVQPPCGRYLFRNGDKCYRPVAADPAKSVGLFPEAPACAAGQQ